MTQAVAAQIEEEVLADAYAGINAFGAGAERFTPAVWEATNELGMGYPGKEMSQEQPTGPPAGDATKNTTPEDGERYAIAKSNFPRIMVAYQDSATRRYMEAKLMESLVSRGKITIIESIPDSLKNTNWSSKIIARRNLRELLRRFQLKEVVFSHGDSSIVAYLTKEGINHTVAGHNSEIKAAAISDFYSLVANAECCYSSGKDEHSNYAGDEDWDYFVSVAEYDGSKIGLIFAIRTIDLDVRSQIYNIATTENLAILHDGIKQGNPANALPNYEASPGSDGILTPGIETVKQSLSVDNVSLEKELNEAGLILTSKDNNKNNQRINAYIKAHYPDIGSVEFFNDREKGYVSVKRIFSKAEVEAIRQKAEEQYAHQQKAEDFRKRYFSPSGIRKLQASIEARLRKDGIDASVKPSRSVVGTLSFYVETADGQTIKVSDHNTVNQRLTHPDTYFVDLNGKASIDEVYASVKGFIDSYMATQTSKDEGSFSFDESYQDVDEAQMAYFEDLGEQRKQQYVEGIREAESDARLEYFEQQAELQPGEDADPEQVAREVEEMRRRSEPKPEPAEAEPVTPIAREDLPAKARDNLAREEAAALRGLRKSFGVTQTNAREFLKETVLQISPVRQKPNHPLRQGWHWPPYGCGGCRRRR